MGESFVIVTMTCIPKGISLVYFKEIEVFMTSYPIEMPATMLFIKQSSPTNTEEVVQQVKEIINNHSLSLIQEVILKVNLEVVLIATICPRNPRSDFCLDLCNVEKNTWPILVNPKPHCR